MKKLILILLLAVASTAFGANVLIRDLSTTVVLPASNSFLLVDGATQGTGKFALTNVPQVTSTRATLAALSIASVATGVTVQTLGGSSVADGQASLYYYNSSSSATPNGTTIIQPTSGSGRWLIVSTAGLPTPTTVTLGGVFSKAGVSHQYLSALGTDGNFTLSTVGIADITGIGTMAGENSNSVNISGGVINGTTIGLTTPAAGAFTSLSTNSTTQFGIAASVNSSGAQDVFWAMNNTGGGAGGFTWNVRASAATAEIGFYNGVSYALSVGYSDGIVKAPTAVNTPRLSNLTSNGLVTTGGSNGTLSITAPSNVAVTSTGSSTSRSLANRFAEEINALDYGADNTGATDNNTAFTAIYNAALANDGTVPELLLNRYIGGFTTPPSNSWTGRPSLTLTGGLNGASGFQAFGNINPQGYMVSIEVANKGTGYNVLSYICSRTNGSPVLNIVSGTFDSRIVAGTSVRFESVSTSCRVITRNSNTQLTLSENMTFSNSDQFVFGMPVPNINGTPAPNDLIPVVGSPRIVRFPAGSYKLTGSWPTMAGLSNVTFEATGANFLYTNVAAGSIGIRNSTAINWNGGDFIYQGSRFSVPTTRSRYPGQEGFAVGGSQWVNVSNVNTWSAFEFGFVAGGDGTVGAYWGQRIKFENCKAINPLGDGFHVTTGNQWVRIINCDAIQPGDDAFAVVNDWDVAARSPTDVEFENCHVDGGLYRGCVALGSNYVRFINITGRDTHGPFLWALADGAFDAPSWVTFENITADNIGNTAVTASDSNSGIGIRAENMTGLRLRNLSFKQDSTVFGNNAVWQVVDSTITLGDWPGRKIQSISGTGTLAGSLNTDLICQGGNGFASLVLEGPHRYHISGTITARSSTGTSGQYWPVIYDNTAGVENGGGSSFQFSSVAERNQLFAEAIVEVQSGSKTFNFKLKQGGGGVTLDAGTTAGPNSVLTATQID